MQSPESPTDPQEKEDGNAVVVGNFGRGDHLGHLIEGIGPMQEATDIRDLFAGLARSVVTALNADAALVSLVDQDRDIIHDVAACVLPPYQLNTIVEEYPLAQYPMTRKVIESGESLEISTDDPDADPNELVFLHELGFSRMLMCSIVVDGRGIGIVEIYRRANRPFRTDDPRHVEVLTTFAANAYSKIQLAAKLEAQYTSTIEALVSALEARDPYTQAHTSRIRDLAGALADAMRVTKETRHAVRLGSILHDVGKIGISDAILRKPGPLTENERAVMRTHPEIGKRMLEGIDFLKSALPVIYHHHERWDGEGYPMRLKGDRIPLGARIVAVCDSFDAMTTDRPYRKAVPVEQALDEIINHSGTQFDPVCAALLVDVIERLGDDNLEDRFVRYAI